MANEYDSDALFRSWRQRPKPLTWWRKVGVAAQIGLALIVGAGYELIIRPSLSLYRAWRGPASTRPMGRPAKADGLGSRRSRGRHLFCARTQTRRPSPLAARFL